jgi:pimeloyl-ACP methyl ester carboxylesterase
MLHHELLGEGPLVVLLHSGGMSGRQWRRLAGLLSSSNRVLVPDLHGSGENPPWPASRPFDCSLDVEALRELLASLGAPAHFVGHSYGGFLALALAREHPTSLRSLAVYDPVAFGVLHASHDEAGLGDLEGVCANPVFLDDALGGSATWFEAFVDYWSGPGSWRALSAAAQASFLRVGRKVYLEARSLLADRTPPTAYACITAPILLLGGERSPVAARRIIALLDGALPHARLNVVAGAGHMGPISHAPEVNAIIGEHIAAADARA